MQIKRRCKTCLFKIVLQDKEEKEWAPEEIEKLIDYYRENEELWNHSVPKYRDRQLKELNLKSLSTLLPGRSVEEIKKEWTILKTIFSREVKREEGSKVSGTGTDSVYSSSWRYFKSLLFIRGSDDIDPQTSTLDVDAENVEPRLHKKPRSNKVTLAKEMEEAKLELYKEAVKCLQMPVAQVPITPTPASNDDEITSFLKSVEMTLRQFSPRDLTRAKKKINDVIFDLEMEILHGESAQPQAPTHPMPFSNITNYNWPYALQGSQGTSSQTTPYTV